MTNFIPIFPLALVVYPGEKLHLHIFEPRYKQLINDCFQSKKPFGIPVVINNKLTEKGTLLEITEISKVYEDGKMDIKTKGIRIFDILELVKDLPEKSYHGAIVNYLDDYNNGSTSIMKKIIEGARLLHKNIDVSKDFGKPDEELRSYDIAHHIGLSIEQEYQILEYENELHRQEYLKRHLTKIMPVVQEMESLKKKIKLNGHFKNLEGFEF
ncbi:MAG: LON peptidase substrate-binding domain-containing protein [Bacteroidota bacterium]